MDRRSISTPTATENVKNARFGFFDHLQTHMNARPRKPRFLRKVRDIVQTGGGGNGVTNFGDIRLLKRSIYTIGSGLPGNDCGRFADLMDFLDM